MAIFNSCQKLSDIAATGPSSSKQDNLAILDAIRRGADSQSIASIAGDSSTLLQPRGFSQGSTRLQSSLGQLINQRPYRPVGIMPRAAFVRKTSYTWRPSPSSDFLPPSQLFSRSLPSRMDNLLHRTTPRPPPMAFHRIILPSVPRYRRHHLRPPLALSASIASQDDAITRLA